MFSRYIYRYVLCENSFYENFLFYAFYKMIVLVYVKQIDKWKIPISGKLIGFV